MKVRSAAWKDTLGQSTCAGAASLFGLRRRSRERISRQSKDQAGNARKPVLKPGPNESESRFVFQAYLDSGVAAHDTRGKF